MNKMTKLKTINEIKEEIEEQKEIIKKNAEAKNYNSWVHSDAINIIGKLQAQLQTSQDIYDEIKIDFDFLINFLQEKYPKDNKELRAIIRLENLREQILLNLNGENKKCQE